MPTGRLRGALVLCVAAIAAACSGPRPGPTPAPQAPHPAGTTQAGPAAAAVPSFTVVASGDVLIHAELAAQAAADARGTGAAYDFHLMLAAVKPVVSAADLAICHLETPLAPAGGPFAYYPAFSVPPQVAAAVRDTGYDTCSTASNHTLDQGAAGVRRTLDDLDAVGVRHTGSARSAAEAAIPDILDVHGVKVAQLSYAYGFNGLSVPSGQPWLANQIDPPAILAAARRARAAGAQVVIISLHWGMEYRHAPTARQRALAHRLLADPAVDLIVGCHAHVTQPFERINGKWVVYGMGNLIARHAQPTGANTAGVIALLRFTRGPTGQWRVTRAAYLPTYVDLGPPIRVVDLPAALADPGLPAATRHRYAAAQAETDRVVTSLGAARAGLVRAAG
jgi:poly-gamma-glutamate synthesis protein (capsule biosynthesis protein)